MASHLALLRGINVGKSVRLPMSQLRSIAAELGWNDIKTYLQSGNLVFSAPAECQTLAADLHQAIAQNTPIAPAVIVQSAAQWRELIARSPHGQPQDPRQVHAYVQQEPISPEQEAAMMQLARTARDRGARDELHVVANVAYLHTPDGMAGSKLAEQLSRNTIVGGGGLTARNWRTVLALHDLLV
ncbi:MAG: DUF1697 domain-containing protein [Beutenbergiaceae bacterium]